MEDDEWVQRLQRVVTEGLSDDGGPAPMRTDLASAPPIAPNGDGLPRDVVNALRDLERRITALDIRVRHLIDQRDRLVDDVADAVIARLDARWARTVGERAEDRSA